MALDTDFIRRQFPLLVKSDVTYLDSGATAQKSSVVLEAMQHFYETTNANVHRGMHALSEEATEQYEASRIATQKFLNAQHAEEIIFTKSCTESINLVAHSYAEKVLQKGDVILLSPLEHHSNIVPWLMLKERIGISVEWMDMDDKGNIDLNSLDTFLQKGTVKLVAITGQSNVLGVRPPLKEIITKAHNASAQVLVDAAQLIAHHPIDVQNLDCDFLTFSGHKIYGPTGIGVLYAKMDLLKAMPPFLGGGMMIADVQKDRFTPADVPQKFEAGTPPIAEAIGLKAAIEWMSQWDWKDIEEYEKTLMTIALEELRAIDGIQILREEDISGCVSFVHDSLHPHDLTDILGKKGICLRAGHHCAKPLHDQLGLTASVRLSVALYNTEQDIRRVRPAIEDAISLFKS